MRLILLALVFFTMAGCGILDNAIRSDNGIKSKAAFALGTTAEKITLSNRTGDIDSVRFNATANGKVYQCYYTSAFAIVTSDVLCSGTDGSTATCDELSKAAGKCK